MDEELKQLAMLALCNAFWQDFSGLCNKYVLAADGLDTTVFEAKIQDSISVFGRDEDADWDDSINLWSMDARERTCGHQTMIEALSHEGATQIHLNGKQIFEMREDGWYFVG